MAHRNKQRTSLNSTPRQARRSFVWKNPGKVIDRNGRPVHTEGSIWWIQEPLDNARIDWNLLATAPDIKDAVRFYVAEVIESLAPRTAYQVFKQLNYCFKRLPQFKDITDISYEAIEGAVSRSRSKSKDWHFAYIRKWYRRCYDEGLPGFNAEVADRLRKLKIRTNQQGQRVMSHDVDDGPLSHDEHFQVRSAVSASVGELIHRVIVMLLLETGARPSQLIQLEEHDLNSTSVNDGPVFYSLSIPRAKQRHIGEPPRKVRRISSKLGLAIEKLIEQNHSTYGQLGPEMPILCTESPNLKKLTKELAPKYRLHMKVATFTSYVSKYPNLANIVSPRTEQLLNLHSLRLRYTFFTKLAEQGAAANHLAELADHSTNSTITVYVSTTSSIVDRLNAALGKDPHYSMTIARFLGQIVSSQGSTGDPKVILGSTPTLKNLGGIGLCGANFLCDLHPPLSCYVCPKFQAWIDGPHQELLEQLEIFIQSLIEQSATQTDRIPYQLTEVVVSIRQLLCRIEEVKNGKRTAAE